MKSRIMNLQEIKSDFNTGFIRYSICLESLRKTLSGEEHYPALVQLTPDDVQNKY